jgi:DNA-binding transcriptional MerR regulator
MSDFLGRILNVKKRTSSSRQAGFKTNQVCDLFDISKATLFRWERKGVIAGPSRDWRNWRLYKKKNMDEIRKVIRARKIVV